MPGSDYYEILGVSQKASADEIKRAYRTLSKKYHPDRNADDPTAEGRFKEVQQAYSVLKDPKKRREYDEFGEAGVGQWSTDPRGQKVYQWGSGSKVSTDDLEDLFSAFGGGGSHASIFDQFFGGQGRGRGPEARPTRGADETLLVSLSFDQAVHGATITVQVHGAGDGKRQTLDVKVPPGVEDGQKIRVQGRAHAGRHGGPPGDLLLICSVKPHRYFRRQGADIYLDVPVTVTEAVLGAKLEVPSVDGRTTVTLPPGKPSGTRLRLKGHGIRKKGGADRGDQYVVIQIVPPKNLTNEQRQHFEELRPYDTVDPRGQCGWWGN